MTPKEARENIGKAAYLIDGEKVLIIKLVGEGSCLTLAGPDLDKYTYIQLGDILSEKEKEANTCMKLETV